MSLLPVEARNSMIELKKRVERLIVSVEIELMQSNSPAIDDGLRHLINSLEPLKNAIERLIDDREDASVDGTPSPNEQE